MSLTTVGHRKVLISLNLGVRTSDTSTKVRSSAAFVPECTVTPNTHVFVWILMKVLGCLEVYLLTHTASRCTF